MQSVVIPPQILHSCPSHKRDYLFLSFTFCFKLRNQKSNIMVYLSRRRQRSHAQHRVLSKSHHAEARQEALQARDEVRSRPSQLQQLRLPHRAHASQQSRQQQGPQQRQPVNALLRSARITNKILARIRSEISLQVVQVNNFLRQQFESTTSRVDLLRVDLDVDSC